MRRLTMILAVVWIPAVASAQLNCLAPGSRVRVEAPALFPGRAIGTIVENVPDSVTFATPVPARPDMPSVVRRYALTRDNVQRLELSSGASRRRRDEIFRLQVAYVGIAGTITAGLVGAAIGSTFVVEKWARCTMMHVARPQSGAA